MGWVDPAEFDGQSCYAEAASFVSLGPRIAGSTGAETAACYLASRLRSVAGTNGFVEVVEFVDATPQGDKTFRNVLLTVPGRRDRLIIVASHYDTAIQGGPEFIGANDSGSSTAVLLALAALLPSAPQPPDSLMLAFLDGEECLQQYGPNDGLHGSRRLVRDLQQKHPRANLRAFILLDMVGDRDLTITIPRNSTPHLVALALNAAHEEGARLHFSLSKFSITDDHVPFLEAGIPALDLIDFEYGSTPGQNDYWHTPEDTLNKLSPKSLEIVGRVLIRMLNALFAETATAPVR